MAPARTRLTLGLLLLASSCGGLGNTERIERHGVVVAEHPLATRVGVDVLAAGGNAADAAVATALALAVVYPQAGNLGGGGFAVCAQAKGDATTYDFREVAPAGFRPELYLDENGDFVAERSLSTALAVGVPGTPAGLWRLLEDQGSGRFTFSQLAAPAIRLAEDGFRVDPFMARDLEGSARKRLEKDPAASAVFLPGGNALAEGAVLKQPELAQTLRALSHGPSGFYTGSVAQAMVDALIEVDRREGFIAAGGSLSMQDLADYEVVERPPLVGWFRGHEVIGMAPPSSGGLVLLQTLALLDGFPLDSERAVDGGPTARALHWWIECMRRSFADRAVHMGDPAFHDVPLQELLAPEWIARRRVEIGELADADVAAWASAPAPESNQTTHLSVLDDKGNAVSLTTTLNASFGSGILVPGAGFLLNNEIDDFAIQAGTPNLYGLVGSEANALAAGKRPLSSMSPTIVRDNGRVLIVIGAPGGPRIITSVMQVLLRIMVYGQDLETAVRAPRLHQQWKPTLTRFEGGWDPEQLDALQTVHGHETLLQERGRYGSVQIIVADRAGRANGFSDPRRGGVAGRVGDPLPAPAHPSAPVRPVER
jgi:gamma-glutamyltranspeptidase / glutathione hydrolase